MLYRKYPPHVPTDFLAGSLTYATYQLGYLVLKKAACERGPSASLHVAQEQAHAIRSRFVSRFEQLATQMELHSCSGLYHCNGDRSTSSVKYLQYVHRMIDLGTKIYKFH